MLNWILTLEFGNDKGLRSVKNLQKLLLVYILPNTSAFLAAVTFGSQGFYDPKAALVLVLMFNVITFFAIQYIVQRNVLSTLDKEALLKFIPAKIPQFIKLRLFFFFMKFYLPILMFSVIFTSFYIEENHLVLMVLFISMIFIMNLQISLSIIVRYCVNRMKRLPLQIVQVSIFLVFVSYASWFVFANTGVLLNMLEEFLNNTEHALYSINSLHLFSVAFIVAVISIGLTLIMNQLNLNLLVPNRNLSFDLKTTMLERIHGKIYGLNLSKKQMLLFEKDIKNVMRNSKVFLYLLGLFHLVIFGNMTFFFLLLHEINDAGIFMSKYYIVFIIGQIILMGIISLSNKEFTDLKIDFNVLKSYHIILPRSQTIRVKTRLLEAFIFPKLTIIYSTFIITVLILSEYTLALIYLINYFQCLLLVKTWSLWIVKTKNKMNSENKLLYYVNIGLIVTFFIILTQLLDSTMEHIALYQLLLLGILIVLYWFHLFVFKDFKKFKTE